jgi:drug/metabolite transporter (DMT)-like permease
LLFGLASVWGSSFFLIKKALIALHPLQVACLRLSIAGLVLSPFFLGQVKNLPRRDIKWLLVVGLAGSGIPAVCFGFAQTHISSAVAGILNSLTPLFTLVIGVLFFAFKAHFRNILGVLVGLLGAIFLITQALEGPLMTNFFFAGLIVFGTMCYATSSNVVSRYLPHRKSFSISVLSYVMLLPLGLIVLFSTDFLHRLQTQPQIALSLGAVFTLAIFGTAIASIFYFMLVQRTSPLFASMVTYLIPLIATILGFFDGEAISMMHNIGLLLIISGVYLSKYK